MPRCLSTKKRPPRVEPRRASPESGKGSVASRDHLTVTQDTQVDSVPLPPADPKFSVSIYSTAAPATFDPRHAEGGAPGFAVVREIRKLPLVRGENTVKFADVAAGIDPTTVSFKSLTAPDSTSVLEQS